MKPFILRFGIIGSIALVAFGCANARNQNDKIAPAPSASSSIQHSTGINNGNETDLGLTVPKGFSIGHGSNYLMRKVLFHLAACAVLTDFTKRAPF